MNKRFVRHRVPSACFLLSKLPAFKWRPISSPTFTAAAVMMSRLPAYFGKKSPAPSTSTNNVTHIFHHVLD